MTTTASSAPHSPPDYTSRADVVLALMVLAFAFLAASFPAGNSDVWRHLASGRLLASGDYQFGKDPFSYTTEGQYWANHSWLYDLGSYLGFQAVGGTGLVALKALGIAGLALLLFGVAKSSGPFWISGFCIFLAILAMSSRLLLQPMGVSFLLLALSLWLLRTGGRAWLFLPLVMALWVNLDSWFILGPVVVGLFWIGQRLEGAEGEDGRMPFWLVPACFVACFVSPHHYHAFILPSELSPGVWGSPLTDDPRFASYFASPWALGAQSGAWNLSAIAYFVLLGLSTCSFVLRRRALLSWRFVLWLPFAILGAWQVRLVPFFAVVAGPVTALNLRERYSAESHSRAGQGILFLAALGGILLSWPGWLQGFERRNRALGWRIQPDPSLVRVADRLKQWHEEGRIASDTRVFAVHPDVAHYCAWHTPQIDGFFDSRFRLFAPVAESYLQVCQAVSSELKQVIDLPGKWSSILKEHRISCVVLYDPNLRRMGPMLKEVVHSPKQWNVLEISGQALIVGWQGGPPSVSRVSVKPFDADEIVFSDRHREAFPAAPERGTVPTEAPLSWLSGYLEHADEATVEGKAAAISLRLFEEQGEAEIQQKKIPALSRHAAGVAAVMSSRAGGLASILGGLFRLAGEGEILADLQQRSPSLPLLSICQARRAIQSNPDDATTWMVLAQAYLLLDRATLEAAPFAFLSPLREVRMIQAIAALNQAVNLNGDLAPAHRLLAQLYLEIQYLDLALYHRKIERNLSSRRGPVGSESAGAFSSRIESLDRLIRDLRRLVHANQNRFFVRAHSMSGDPLGRAQLAVELGLARQAIDDVLLESHADLYGVEGLALLLELLLKSGRIKEARALLDRKELVDNPLALGYHNLSGASAGQSVSYRFPAYDWFNLCQAAAAGHYELARQSLDGLRKMLQQGQEQILKQLLSTMGIRLSAELGLGAIPGSLALRLSNRFEKERVVLLLRQTFFVQAERGDLLVLEGLLLLEQGKPLAAQGAFEESLELYRSARFAPLVPGEPLARYYRTQLFRFQKEGS